jgi:AraC-like DNA-binding protein
MSTTTRGRNAAEAAWREQMDVVFGHLLPEAIHDGCPSPRGQVTSTDLGRAHAFQVSGTPQLLRRTHRSIAQAPADPLKLCILKTGRATVRQGDVDVTIEPGQLALYDTGRPYAIRLEGGWACAVMTLPREALVVPERVVTAAMRHAFPADEGLGAVLAQLLDSEVEADVAGHLGEAGLHLVAGLVCHQEPALVADPGGAALRARILAYVRKHLADPELSHRTVARAHNVSVRTLHRLFADEELSVAESIRALRLDAVHRDLRDVTQAHRGVMTIASQWGYTNQAQLTRTFRARFGRTPAAFRRGQHGGQVYLS